MAGADASPGAVRGHVRLAVEGAGLEDVGPIVVFLEPADGRALPPGPSMRPGRVRQHDARFSPAFLAISVGQSVDMPNDDAIYHNVFSYSKPNEFDLGLYPAGQSRTITFRHPGVVRTYCSIHESMSGTIFVAPTPWFAVLGAKGEFELKEVPPGAWRVRTWCERLPDAGRDVSVASGRTVTLEVTVGEAAP
jgi:plastocyanin